MPRLILLNGPPACGKSTLARLYVDDHPLALDLDIDLVREQIGRWQDHGQEAGLLARSVALASARAHLGNGYDVVVPQLLARPAFIEELEALAGELDCAFHEIVLLDSRENSVRRYIERAADRAKPAAEPPPPRERLAAMDEMYDRLLALLAVRPGATVIRIRDGEVAQAYQNVLDAVAQTDV